MYSMDNDKWKTSPKIFHKGSNVYIGSIKLEFGSKKIHGKYRKPEQFVYGQYVTKRGSIRHGHKRMKARTYRYIIPFDSQDISVVEGTLKEPRFWYNGGAINISKWINNFVDVPSQELEKICIDYKRRLVRGSVTTATGARCVHWFDFTDPQIIVRGFREDE
jgi:hypothetical protein